MVIEIGERLKVVEWSAGVSKIVIWLLRDGVEAEGLSSIDVKPQK
jgi:hypothetical protein